MQLTANAETIDRLVDPGVDFSKAFHAEFEKDPTGPEAQFLRGEFSGWRSTLHTEYHEGRKTSLTAFSPRRTCPSQRARLKPISLAPVEGAAPIPNQFATAEHRALGDRSDGQDETFNN